MVRIFEELSMLAILFSLLLLISIGIVSGENVIIINSSITNPIIQVKNISVNSESKMNNLVITTQLNISKEPQIIAYTQNSPETISVSGNLSTNGVNVIVPLQSPLESNISFISVNGTLTSQSIELNPENGSHITVNNQNLKIVQAATLNKTYEINNINLIASNEIRVVNTQIVLNKTELHNISISAGNITGNMLLNSNGIIVKTNLTLELDSTGVYVTNGVGKIELKNLPDMVPEIAENNSLKDIELKMVQQEPVYEIKETRYGKILGLFPASMDVEIQVNANNTEIKTVKKPWWSVFFVQ